MGERISTGLADLDRMLGGGLLPGTMTVVMGATGVGKTQLGVHFLEAGRRQEGEPGIVFDMTSRGDSQNHIDYARRMCGWEMTERLIDEAFRPEHVWDRDATRRDLFHIFRRSGRRVTRQDMDTTDWQEWKVELNQKLDQAIAFFYGNFVHGVRRCVIDGIEPVEKVSESFQFHVFDYIYHQILHKDADWVARDLFRVHFREQEPEIQARMYDHRELACLMLYTSHEVLLDQLLSRPIESGDELANANTIILMGKIRDGVKMRRALHVAKHRGSACDDSIVPFEIGDKGLTLLHE